VHGLWESSAGAGNGGFALGVGDGWSVRRSHGSATGEGAGLIELTSLAVVVGGANYPFAAFAASKELKFWEVVKRGCAGL
jgi:hypothetical protein